MADIAERYDRLAADFAATIAAVPADRWGAPSPCEGWTARDVVAHMVDNHRLFEGFVGRVLGDVPPVEDDPAGAFAAARAVVSRHLHDPAAAGATFEGAVFGHMSFAEGIDRFVCADLLVHRWDLARAAGLEVTLPADEVARVHGELAAMGDVLRGPGAFGPEVPAPEGADAQARFLAFLGRRP
ncbi:MAG TPA: TIGR03086 family metal-binding protein [Acidimicrobiales bacterium]|nr:TIGR03086 family metal-binding protein [Acidimicrobiales bacterium]